MVFLKDVSKKAMLNENFSLSIKIGNVLWQGYFMKECLPSKLSSDSFHKSLTKSKKYPINIHVGTLEL